MASSTPAIPPVVFMDAELAVLGLFDHLQQLQLELALLRSQESPSATSKGSRGNQRESETDRIRLLEAKATVALRNCIVENTVALEPTLNAVHHATHASPPERDLLPSIEQRDVTAIRAAQMCSDLMAGRRQLAELERDNLALCQQNIKLAEEALDLAGRFHPLEQATATSSRFEEEVTGLERDVAARRRRWKVIKGTTSAIVAGSSLDWVRDERLRNLVLDSADE